MAVLEHEVHEKVKIDSTFRYGCNSVRNPNRSMKGYYAPDREYRPDGTYYQRLVFIHHVNSKPCRCFALWDTDPACTDCKTERDEEYANTMRGLM
jgi:hypothetical protein